MNLKYKELPQIIVRKLLDNPALVKIYVIPGVIFFLDFILRGVLGVDLIDAGADMALLAVATFISLLIDDKRERENLTAVAVVFILIFLVLWIVCLRIVSLQDPMVLFSFDIRLMLSWFIGITAFIFSGILADVIIQNSQGSTVG